MERTGERATDGRGGVRLGRRGPAIVVALAAALSGALGSLALPACSLQDLSYLQTGGAAPTTTSGGGGTGGSTGGSAGGTTTTVNNAGWAIETSSATQSHVTVPDLAIPVDFTLEVWVKRTSVSLEQAVISKQQAAIQADQLRLGFEGGLAYFMMSNHAGDTDLWDPVVGYRLAAGVPLDEWVHLAVTKQGSSLALYVGGVAKATYTSAATLEHQGTALFELGASVAADGVGVEKVLDGSIDEVRLWDIARAEADIQADMDNTISDTHPQYAHLLAYYELNEGTGTTAADTTGQHPATLVNAPTWVESTAPIGQ